MTETVSSIQGVATGPEPTPLQLAQQRTYKAAMAQPMTANGAAISAFVNGILHSCKLAALVEFLLDNPLEPPDLNVPPLQRFEAIFERHLREKAELLENTAREAPRILANRGARLDG